jgi:rifampicin phosphotransferase
LRLVSQAIPWYAERIFEAAHSSRRQATATGHLDGVAAAPGRYRGPARIIGGERGFDKLRTGDVVVCPIASPVWSVVFPAIGALVTDSGGILSHPAIIAREHGIPAVVATGNATELIHHGQQVTVDGTAGIVELC